MTICAVRSSRRGVQECVDSQPQDLPANPAQPLRMKWSLTKPFIFTTDSVEESQFDFATCGATPRSINLHVHLRMRCVSSVHAREVIEVVAPPAAEFFLVRALQGRLKIQRREEIKRTRAKEDLWRLWMVMFFLRHAYCLLCASVSPARTDGIRLSSAVANGITDPRVMTWEK